MITNEQNRRDWNKAIYGVDAVSFRGWNKAQRERELDYVKRDVEEFVANVLRISELDRQLEGVAEFIASLR